MEIQIIDYGMGNIKSVSNALEYLGSEPRVVENSEDLEIERMIIPGVGAFGKAMKNLEPFRLKITKAIDSRIPVLGICLGMQVFFEDSDESGGVKGLSALSGKVTKPETNFRLPQIGWNSLNMKREDCPLFDDIDDGYVYYAHSYHVETRKEFIVATSDYGSEITGSVWDENLYGTQFHPEKSGKLGLKILKNFMEL